MSKVDDMDLFIHVVKAGGLAAAGRQIGLSPASMTARINALEQRYNTRLLHRSTRSISLTDAGQKFYDACLRVIDEVKQAEAVFQNGNAILSGKLRITATSDFGRQYIAPAISEFVALHPEIQPYLHLTDSIVNLIEHGYDLAIRYGNLPDSNLVIRSLAKTRRVLIASPDYLKEFGIPRNPSDLKNHRCLTMERLGEPFNEWHFQGKKGLETIRVSPALSSNDGAIVRYWAVNGKGIAYKSIWDVKRDIKNGNLQTVLDDFVLGFQSSDSKTIGLQLVYANKKYQPAQVTEFIDFLVNFMKIYSHDVKT